MRRPGISADEMKWLNIIVTSARRMLNVINMSSELFNRERGTYTSQPVAVDAKQALTARDRAVA